MKSDTQEKLLKAYNDMRDAVKNTWHDAEEKTLPTLKQALEKAEQTASDLGELSREEIQKLSDYLQRDIHDAAHALADNGRQLADWLEFDLDLAESKFGEWVAKVANPTTLELQLWRERAKIGEWHTGEITGAGTLVCDRCGEEIHFDKPGHIPPCPKCKGTVFRKEYGG
jgi:hypothetical protein